jgi:CDGSH-type Zn-finger protein
MLHRSVHYDAREDMTSIQLTALPDGPYRLEGEVTIINGEGRPVADRGSPVHLCRCGHSTDKPFCDGPHARAGRKEDA